MIRRLFVSAFVFFLMVNNSVSQQRKISVADSILSTRGEICFSFSLSYFNSELGKILSIKSIGEKVLAYANRSSFDRFLKLNIDFELLPDNFHASRLKSTSVLNPDLVYPSYSAYLQTMQGFEQKYNLICELHQIGLSVQGRKLLALKISGKGAMQSKPSVLLTSTIHGNELVGYKLSLWLIEYLLENYSKDLRIAKLLNETEIWIYPLANPDGTFYGGDNTVVQAKRFNSNNLDLNRNFPDPEVGQHPDNAERQPETAAIMDFYKSEKVVLSAALHTGDELINYPWDTWAKLHADNDWYRLISRNYVDMVHAKNRLYMTDFENGIINGFSWYRITGGLQDYVNYFLNSREITVEMSRADMPDSLALVKLWDYNREALISFLEQSQYGFMGKIANKGTGNPLKAKVELLNHDNDNSWIFSNNESGIFYRFVAPGNYTIKISAPGFLPFMDEFSIGANERKIVNVNLESNNDFVAVYPNPFQTTINLLFKNEVQADDEIQISLTDMTGRMVFKSIINNYRGNNVELTIPSIPDGLYILKLHTKDFLENFEVLKIK